MAEENLPKSNKRNCFIIVFLLSLLIFLMYHLLDQEGYGMNPDSNPPKWIMIKSRSCPFCIKQMQELQKASPLLKENLRILDQGDPATKKINLINFKGVPHFQNTLSGETFSGFTSIEKLENKIAKNIIKGRNAPTYIHRGVKYQWDKSKFPY